MQVPFLKRRGETPASQASYSLSLASQSEVCFPEVAAAALTPPGTWLEVLTLRPHPRPTYQSKICI